MYNNDNLAYKTYEYEEERRPLTTKEVMERRNRYLMSKKRKLMKQNNPKLYQLTERHRKYTEKRPVRIKKRKEVIKYTTDKVLQFPANSVNHKFYESILLKFVSKRDVITKNFLIFISIASISTMCLCINYLQSKADLTYKIQQVANLESELNELHQDNDAYLNSLNSSLDLNKIKAIAINKLGMKYPNMNQVQYYKKDKNNNICRQYISLSELE